MGSSRSLYLGSEFAISCGTITFDITKHRVLVLHYKPKDEYFLPKGRKDIGERMEETCLRETLEEAGVRATLFHHHHETKATKSNQAADSISSGHTEPIAVTERHDSNGVRKIIFWFIAQADSSAHLEGRDAQDSRDFDAVWVPVDEATGWVTYHDDKQIILAAIQAVYGRDQSQ